MAFALASRSITTAPRSPAPSSIPSLSRPPPRQGDGGPTPHDVNGAIGLYYLGSSRQWVRYDSPDPGFRHLNATLQNLQSVAIPPGDGRSVLQYLQDEGVQQHLLPLADAGYGNTMAAPLEELR